MKSWVLLAAALIPAVLSGTSGADETVLRQRIAELERRVAVLERRLDAIGDQARWKDPVLWRRIEKGMTGEAVGTLLGSPARIEEQVFSTWYYHPTSKVHSFVWFDEGRVLGWEGPQ